MMVVMGAGNVLLDVLFLYGMDLGVFGAGLASVIATAVACLLGIWWLCDERAAFLLVSVVLIRVFLLCG